ncbi:hypothetical protein D3C72_1437340 [compost metagenome]
MPEPSGNCSAVLVVDLGLLLNNVGVQNILVLLLNAIQLAVVVVQFCRHVLFQAADQVAVLDLCAVKLAVGIVRRLV